MKGLALALFLAVSIVHGSDVIDEGNKDVKNVTDTTPSNDGEAKILPSPTPKDTERITTPLFVVKDNGEKVKDFKPSPLLGEIRDQKDAKHALDNLQISDTQSDVYADVQERDSKHKHNPDHEGYLQQQYYKFMEKIKTETEDKGITKVPPDLYTNMRYLKLLEKYKSRTNNKDYQENDDSHGAKTSHDDHEVKIVPSVDYTQHENYHTQIPGSHETHHVHIPDDHEHHHIVAHHSLSHSNGHHHPEIDHHAHEHYVKTLQDPRGAVDIYTKQEEPSSGHGDFKQTQAYYPSSQLPDVVLKFLKSYKPVSEHHSAPSGPESESDYGKLLKDYKTSSQYYTKPTDSSQFSHFGNHDHYTSLHKFQTETAAGGEAYTGHAGLNTNYGELTAHKPLKFETDVKSTTFTTGLGTSDGKLLPHIPVKGSPHPYPFLPPEVPKYPVHLKLYEHHGNYGKEAVKYDHHGHNGKAMGMLKKAVGMLAAFIPLGLFLAALPPTVLYINSTQPSLPSRQRSLDEDAPEINDPIFELVEKYGLESLDDPECENRLFCEMSRLGESPDSNIIQKGFWEMAHNTSNEMAENLGLREVFKAIRTDSCTIYRCKEKNKKKSEQKQEDHGDER